jgi:hypothetical protein
MAGIDIEHLKQQQAKLHHVADQGIPTTLAAKEAASTIPIVMAALGDRWAAGCPRSRSTRRQRDWIECVFDRACGKRVELMKEVIPGVTRVGFFNNLSKPVADAARELIAFLKSPKVVRGNAQAGHGANVLTGAGDRKRLDGGRAGGPSNPLNSTRPRKPLASSDLLRLLRTVSGSEAPP